MTREAYEELVHRLEAAAGQRPAAYKLRVLLLALLGYGYVLGLLALAVVLIVLGILAVIGGGINAAILKLEIVLLGFAWLLLRALWVRLEPPTGLPLDARTAPVLFQELGELRRAVRAPRIHHVLVTPEFNASITQVPRLGVFGWQRNYLCLGLPLLQALAPEECRAVLAHELGHLSRAHSRFATWIYRVRLTWERLLEQVQQSRGHKWLFERFFRWYSPYFGAYSFVLARTQEYEADRHAADVSTPRVTADALARVYLSAEALNREFWQPLYQRIADHPEPPANGFHDLGEALSRGRLDGDADSRLRKALMTNTGTTDTHPCLRDRLAALGEAPRVPPPPARSAAGHYLADALPEIAEILSQGWREGVAPAWRQRHEEMRQEREQLAALEEKRAAEGLSPDEDLQRAILVESLHGEEEALPLYKGVLERDMEHASASFAYGRLLLGRDDPAGVAWIEQAMARDPEAALPGAHLIASFWQSRGREDRAAPYLETLDGEISRLEAAQEERAQLRKSDELIEHGLDGAAVEALAAQLRRQPKVKAAWLARKHVQHYGDQSPVYVLQVQLGGFHTEGWYAKTCQRLAQEIEFPGEAFVSSREIAGRRLRNRMDALPSAKIYRR